MADGSFRGVSLSQDGRFSDKTKKLLKSIKIPPEIDRKVDLSKVEMNVIQTWISKKLTEILGFEDEVVINFTETLIKQKDMDPRNLEYQLVGFMENNCHEFVLELWSLLISAEENGGIPPVFVEEQKKLILQKMDEAKQIQDNLRSKGIISSRTNVTVKIEKPDATTHAVLSKDDRPKYSEKDKAHRNYEKQEHERRDRHKDYPVEHEKSRKDYDRSRRDYDHRRDYDRRDYDRGRDYERGRDYDRDYYERDRRDYRGRDYDRGSREYERGGRDYERGSRDYERRDYDRGGRDYDRDYHERDKKDRGDRVSEWDKKDVERTTEKSSSRKEHKESPGRNGDEHKSPDRDTHERKRKKSPEKNSPAKKKQKVEDLELSQEEISLRNKILASRKK